MGADDMDNRAAPLLIVVLHAVGDFDYLTRSTVTGTGRQIVLQTGE